jgi:hypothetical protein
MRKDGTLVNVSKLLHWFPPTAADVLLLSVSRYTGKTAADALNAPTGAGSSVSRTTIGELVTSIAHEVNQPITAVITYETRQTAGFPAAQSGRSRMHWETRPTPHEREKSSENPDVGAEGTPQMTH